MNKTQVISIVKKILAFIVRLIRNNQGTITVTAIGAGALAWYLWGGDADSGVAMAAIIAGIGHGSSVNDEPATTDNVEIASEELLRSAVDSRIVKIRPSSTPIDQISRWGGSRLIDSMKAEYYAVDNKPFADSLVSGVSSTEPTQTIRVHNKSMFSASDTLLLPDVDVTDDKGKISKGLVLYVLENMRDGLSVMVVNNYNDKDIAMPTLKAGEKVIRMGRAAAELDVQTDQYEALPTKDYNYCQIFKQQIEQSTMMRLSNKEVKWSLSDMEESAIVDMRLAMEKSFIFGHRARMENPDKKESIYLTGGIWNQAEKQYDYSTLNADTLIEICREAFTGCGGSSRKILIGGSGLIAQLNKQQLQRVAVGAQNKVCWGINFTEIVTHFGSLYVTMSEIFDQCNHANDGMIIDPEYITKYCHIPFNAERLDLRKAGQRNTDAIVITEASCVVLRYPTAHMRIVNK